MSRAPSVVALLTARERTVAWYVTEGYTSKHIARLLDITYLTVRKHRENILRKLAVQSTAELIACGVVDNDWKPP